MQSLRCHGTKESLYWFRLQPSAAKDATILSASKPIGSVRPVMASNRPRSLVYNVRKQQHMKMAAGMTSNPDLQLNSARSQRSSLLHHLNGYHSASQPTSPVKQYSMKSCGVSTGSLPINTGVSRFKFRFHSLNLTFHFIFISHHHLV